ncbi:hypothetical protein [Dyadobacter psychrotolerans]|uniref:Outer membrane protein beta-barrel domain-containing protein n=1 Tax=Dyadobacter psychrotolerans TaxID=2541721 RepID=A0A4R5DKF7_9BACT|nr:hypothetical protein [Dyadobacter psychrotolerans]TDE13877.1 hypothetical protein E0F88_18495 [Dyadobacter psychrotolerans]
MKTVVFLAVCLVTCSMSLYSCRTVYAPNALNVPLFQEKGELKATIATNNLQVATAVTEHIGIMVNGYLNAYTSDDKDFKNNGKGAEIGIGYFGHSANRITYETYAGAGLYNVKMKESNKAKTFDSDAVKYFVQPAVGWVTQYFEIAASPRLSVIKYSAPDITGYTVQEQASNYLNIVDQKAHAFLEPTLIVRGGYRFVKLQAQYGHSFKLSKNDINYDDGVGSIGLIFDIASWYKTGK